MEQVEMDINKEVNELYYYTGKNVALIEMATNTAKDIIQIMNEIIKPVEV